MEIVPVGKDPRRIGNFLNGKGLDCADDPGGAQSRGTTYMTEKLTSLKQQGYTLVEEAVPSIGYSVNVVTACVRCIGFLDQSLN